MILEETITCPICGAEKKMLGAHMLRVHNMSVEETKHVFNMDSLTAPAVRERRKGSGNGFYGKHHSKETLDTMYLTKYGKVRVEIVPLLCKGNCGNFVKTSGYEYCQKCACRIKHSGENNASKRPEVREKLVENHCAYSENGPLRASRISKAKTGVTRPDMQGENNPAKRPENRKKISEGVAALWNNPVIKAERVKTVLKANRIKINNCEKQIETLLTKLCPGEYKFVGNGDFILGGKCPDFINVNNQKKVIEFFGDYWHGEERTGISNEAHEQEKVNYFLGYGFQTLVIWEHELKDTELLEEKIMNFTQKGRSTTVMEMSYLENDKMVEQSDLYSDVEKVAEMTTSISDSDMSNNLDIPLFASPTLVTSDLYAQKGFLSSAGFKVLNPGLLTYGDIVIS